MKNFKYLLLVSIALVFFNTEIHAATKGQIVAQCSEAISGGNPDEAAQLAVKVGLFINIFNKAVRSEAVDCLDAVYGKGWFYDDASGSFLNNDPTILQKSLAGLSESAINDRMAKLDSVRGAIAERRLEEEKAKLEKQIGCVSVMISRTKGNISSIDTMVNQANRSLILQDTHKACSSLYEKDQTTTMLNQSCIEAFQILGHPKLLLAETDTKSALSNELSDLTELKEQLEVNLVTTDIKLLEANGTVMPGGIEQAVKVEMEANSCAEFGYEGVYLD